MTSFISYLIAHWAVISAVSAFLLANFLTAATQHPDVVPGNVLHLVQFAAQFISLFTHSGSAATFKLPFTVQPAPGVALRGHAHLGLLASLAVACLLATACASVFGPNIKTDLTACGTVVTKDVEQQVAATLLTGGSGYEIALYGMVTKIGKDGLICAIQAALADFAAQHASEPAAAPAGNALMATVPDAHQLAIARGKAALASLGASPH